MASFKTEILADVERLLPIVHSMSPEFRTSSFNFYLPNTLDFILNGHLKSTNWRTTKQKPTGVSQNEESSNCFIRATNLKEGKNLEKLSFSFIACIEKLGKCSLT